VLRLPAFQYSKFDQYTWPRSKWTRRAARCTAPRGDNALLPLTAIHYGILRNFLNPAPTLVTMVDFGTTRYARRRM
jgi:hypothetical protein